MRGDPKHDEEMTVLQEDVKKAKELGVPASYEEGYAIKCWDGLPDQRDVAIFK